LIARIGPQKTSALLGVSAGHCPGSNIRPLRHGSASLTFGLLSQALRDQGLRAFRQRKYLPMLTNILIIIFIIMLIGALPNWPHSANWGYLPSGTLGVVLIVLLALLVTGRL
jgi:hypothetical protein